MKKIDLGQTITALANIGVLIGIIFLAVEINQNNEALATQARLDRESVLRNSWDRTLGNPDIVRATVKARAGETLSPEEAYLLNALNRAIFTDLSLIYHQVQDGLLGQDAIPIALWRDAFHRNFPRIAETWSLHKRTHAPDFVQWYEENIIEPGPLE